MGAVLQAIFGLSYIRVSLKTSPLKPDPHRCEKSSEASEVPVSDRQFILGYSMGPATTSTQTDQVFKTRGLAAVTPTLSIGYCTGCSAAFAAEHEF